MRDAVEVLLHAQQRNRCHAGQGLRKRIDAGHQLLGGDDLGQEADIEHRLRIKLFSRQEHPLGRIQSEPAHVALKPALIIVQTEPRGRHKAIHGRHADPEVAGNAQIGRAAIDTPLDSGNRDRTGLLQDIDKFAKRHVTLSFFGAKRIDVKAAAEILAGAQHPQHQDILHLVDGLDVIGKNAQIRRVHAIGDIGSRQGHGGDAAGHGQNWRLIQFVCFSLKFRLLAHRAYRDSAQSSRGWP